MDEDNPREQVCITIPLNDPGPQAELLNNERKYGCLTTVCECLFTLLMIIMTLSICAFMISGIGMPIQASLYVWGLDDTPCTIANATYTNNTYCYTNQHEIDSCPMWVWNISYTVNNQPYMLNICENNNAIVVNGNISCYTNSYLDPGLTVDYLKSKQVGDNVPCLYYDAYVPRTVYNNILFKDVYEPLRDRVSFQMIVAISVISGLIVTSVLLLVLSQCIAHKCGL